MSFIGSISPQCYTNCHPYVSRTKWVSTPFPTNRTSERQLAAQYPWWGGQWRTPDSPPLPQVFYPYPIFPRGVCEPDWPEDPQVTKLDANWALTR